MRTNVFIFQRKRPELIPILRCLNPNLFCRNGSDGRDLFGPRAIAAQVWDRKFWQGNNLQVGSRPTIRRLSAGSILTARLIQHVLDVDGVHEMILKR